MKKKLMLFHVLILFNLFATFSCRSNGEIPKSRCSDQKIIRQYESYDECWEAERRADYIIIITIAFCIMLISIMFLAGFSATGGGLGGSNIQ